MKVAKTNLVTQYMDYIVLFNRWNGHHTNVTVQTNTREQNYRYINTHKTNTYIYEHTYQHSHINVQTHSNKQKING